MQPSVTAADLEILIATFLDHWAGRNVSFTANFSKTLHDAGPHCRIGGNTSAIVCSSLTSSDLRNAIRGCVV
jgi:hypothetical protein